MATQPAITPEKFSNQRKPLADERTRKWRDVAEGDVLLATLHEVVKECRVTAITAQDDNWGIYITWKKKTPGGLDPNKLTMLDSWHVVEPNPTLYTPSAFDRLPLPEQLLNPRDSFHLYSQKQRQSANFMIMEDNQDEPQEANELYEFLFDKYDRKTEEYDMMMIMMKHLADDAPAEAGSLHADAGALAIVEHPDSIVEHRDSFDFMDGGSTDLDYVDDMDHHAESKPAEELMLVEDPFCETDQGAIAAAIPADLIKDLKNEFSCVHQESDDLKIGFEGMGRCVQLNTHCIDLYAGDSTKLTLQVMDGWFNQKASLTNAHGRRLRCAQGDIHQFRVLGSCVILFVLVDEECLIFERDKTHLLVQLGEPLDSALLDRLDNNRP
ncbi:hypothetical protein AURANDRAFT_68071 [Aureococcus anophagefferens]|uniref:Uncharacterized protein n=1 Tax=Aureococcus anophagefferens TaxID=44056 RepID=F0YNE2_AURAN|nr:hypothetical protein AURANDRAFT_68071 [Aureococcus anophagefferens]EGB03371.1 hypothetical protein AURANDRAFT_68071 [Aureococcus anophagefferens]|eukprot:XP_009041944.1 hypothetical protein AURANDRAFT_68071 [Aureococcus anophagefferens]